MGSSPAVQGRMFSEAAEAAAVVARQLVENRAPLMRVGRLLRRLSPHTVVTCARGSSDHAATFAKYLIETRTGIPTASAAPSVSSLYGTRPKLEQVLYIAISQSGKSPDLLATVEAARAGGAFVLALVNDAGSPLAGIADEVVPLCAGPELSIAATKSYIAALAAIVALVARWVEDSDLQHALAGAPQLLDHAWALEWPVVGETLRNASNLYVIGRGMGLGVAQEAALKLKETCGLHAEAFSSAEVRHGPMALVSSGFPLIVFRQSDETEEGIDGLIGDLVARRGKVLVAGPAPSGAVALPLVTAHPVLEPMLQVQTFYRAAHALSLARGLDPDRPPHLAKVTETL